MDPKGVCGSHRSGLEIYIRELMVLRRDWNYMTLQEKWEDFCGFHIAFLSVTISPTLSCSWWRPASEVVGHHRTNDLRQWDCCFHITEIFQEVLSAGYNELGKVTKSLSLKDNAVKILRVSNCLILTQM